jgi:hypothetical protein
MADYVPTLWVDDDGSNQVGTPFDAAHMNKIEQGIVAAGSALPKPTTDWNLAVTPFSWRSLNNAEVAANGFVGTINGPGDPLNLPDAVGYTLVQDSQIVQRVYALGLGFFTRVKPQGGAWTTWVADLAKPPLLTGLLVGAPTPAEGDERYFQNAAMKTAGIMWKFRYDKTAPAGQPKWVYVGGVPLMDFYYAPTVYTTGSPAYTWAGAMPKPQVVAPLQGDYLVEAVASVQAGPYGDVRMGTFYNGGQLGWGSFESPGLDSTFATKQRIDNLASGSTVDMRFCASIAAVDLTVYDRQINLTPIRVVM